LLSQTHKLLHRYAPVGNVAVVTKDVAYEGSTHYAQGGISAVISLEDTVEEHIRDTQVGLLHSLPGLLHSLPGGVSLFTCTIPAVIDSCS
jgi:hypothetical protein